MSRKKAIHSHYEPRIDRYREHHEILDWADRASQHARFEVLAANADLSGRSLLDIGCGLGDLWQFLKDRQVAAHYTGVDLVDKMISAARRRHPDAVFVTGDIFSDDLFAPAQFDVVFASGIFNLDLGNNEAFLPHALGRMLRLAGTHVVFNMLHARAEKKYPHCYYYEPAKVLELLRPLPCAARCLDDYLPNDFTIVCEKS